MHSSSNCTVIGSVMFWGRVVVVTLGVVVVVTRVVEVVGRNVVVV